ncbi:MAG TPA: DUF6785 family protein [Tepidisphaeraceae bacterium]|jgi:hypothetical protein
MITPEPAEPASRPNTQFAEPRPMAVTWRSVLIGLAGVILICGLTPYNDYVVANTFLVGNFLPVGLVLILLSVVLGVNLPLRRFWPSAALRPGELAVATIMMLASCSLPSSGLFRYLPGSIVSVYTAASERPESAEVLRRAEVPSWLIPSVAEIDPAAIGTSSVIRQYRGRSADGSVPWGAWLIPMASWGLFIALLWGLLLFLCVIVRRQWAENERLAFPLATVYGALLEAPEPGRQLNWLFRSRGFWIAAGSVFLLHAFNSLHKYQPLVPEIPLGYNFSGMMADAPLSFMQHGFKTSKLYFCLIGIAFFIQTKMSFSMWAFFVLAQLVYAFLGSRQIVFDSNMQQDQTFGAMLMLTTVIIYIGRHHWWMVIRHMFGRRRAGEDESRYLPYAFAGWGAMTCFAGLIAFLMFAGVTFIAATAIVLVLVMMLMLVARIVAETGLVYVQLNWQILRFWYYPVLIPAQPLHTTHTSFFFSGWITALFHDVRESFAGFFITGLRVTDHAAYERSHRWRTAAPVIIVVVLALVIGYMTAASSMLWIEYRYANMLNNAQDPLVNGYGAGQWPSTKMLDPAQQYPGGVRAAHAPAVQIGIGGAVVAVCSVLRLTVSWWPLHPIGYVLLFAWATEVVWFSIFVGWLAKVVIVRLGGSTLLMSGRPVFIGLVVGEAVAAGFWLIVSLVMNWLGYEYQIISLLPT